jgi:hypothetical protein
MARGPDGQLTATAIDPAAEHLNRVEYEMTVGLELVIDGAIQTFHATGPFAYGVSQALSPRMREVLGRRYREAGWGDVRVSEGATGGSVVVLHRDAAPGAD